MITTFRGEYSWLSNFATLERPLTLAFGEAVSVEHAYQAAKCVHLSDAMEVAKHPAQGLKRFVKTKELKNFDRATKRRVMRCLLKYKFSDANPTFKERLLQTGNEYIEEGNVWGDTFWGVDMRTGIGDNNLGLLIMDIREELMNENSK